MAGYDGRGARFPLTIVRGADLAFTVTATDDAGAAINLSSATIDAEVYNSAGTVAVTMSDAVSGAGSNVVALSLTDTQTTALADTSYSWTLWVSRSGDRKPWLAGRVTVTDGDRGRSSNGANATLVVDADVNVAVTINAAGSMFVPRDMTQEAESDRVRAFRIVPATPSAAPFGLIFDSYENAAAGAGTFNHLSAFGYNYNLPQDAADAKPNVHGWWMGMEDNYYDFSVDLQYGAEWYVEWVSPDAVTTPFFRPIFTRVAFSGQLVTRVSTQINLGSDANSAFAVTNNTGAIFSVTSTGVSTNRQLIVTGNNLQLTPATGQPVVSILSAAGQVGPTFRMGQGGSQYTMSINTPSPDKVDFYDKSSRIFQSYNYGATTNAAVIDMVSSLRIRGGVGFYDTAPVTTKPTVTGSRGGNAALASLLTALASQGLITDSSS